MARKLKISPNARQPGLFDLFDDPETLPVHPSITDFVVKTTMSGGNRHATDEDDENDQESDLNVPLAGLNPIDSISFISFGSGSSGNCAYLGDINGGFLIDAGVDPKKVEDGLKSNGISPEKVKGICLTHDHSDHVRYAYTMLRQNKSLRLYATPKTMTGILRRHSISRRIKDYHTPIYKEFPFNIGRFEITAFEVSHDGTDNSGFFIRHGGQTFAIATDLGCITPRVEYYMGLAQNIMIESNYDALMLQNGRYPAYLKARITADTGHLDNRITARFIADTYSERLRNVFLCHLSLDNNKPELALAAVKDALRNLGVSGIGDGSETIESRSCPVQLVALPRYECSRLFTLRID